MASSSPTIPVGYKQTEIGVIPEDWELKTFGEIFDFKPTASNSRSDLTESDTTHYIHYGDIHTVFHRHLDLEKRDTPMISRELCKNAALVKNGDWVMADASEDYSGIGKAIEISGITDKSTVVAGLHTFLLRDRAGVYVPGFKGHLGEAKYLHDQYVRVSVGLKVFGVTKTSLRDLFIPVPPKSEQIRIEEILTDSDSQIQALENLISKKRYIKQGTMQELLTEKTRLPGFSGKWKLKCIGEIAQVIGGGTPSTQVSHYWGGTVNWFTPTEIGSTKYVFDSERKLTDSGLKNSSSSLLPIGAILLTSRAGIGNLSILNSPACTNQGFQSIVCNDEVDNEFLYYVMLTKRSELERRASGSTFLEISPRELKSLLIPLPQFNEQQAIAEVLSDMDQELAAL